jgi:hypothetical protein
MKRPIIVLVYVICVLTFVSAGVYASSKKDSPVAPSQTPPAVKSSQGDSMLSGKVAETMDSGGYTYINLDQGGRKKWVAIPLTEVKVGQQVTLQPGVEMGNFTSKTLKRTFDNIIFSGGLVSNSSGGAAAKPATAQKAASTSAVTKPAEKIKVEKATGPDAYTVSEIHEKLTTLNEKTAVVKGKVVKVSQGIMGKNWIHLQDGTGDPGLGTNKLVTTSQDLPTVGDIVTMKGKIYKDKDFGSGYKYEVIMEEAKIQK